MNVHGKEAGCVNEMRITVRQAEEKPNYQKTAAELLKRCREFYTNPQNEREFEEWKKKKGR